MINNARFPIQNGYIRIRDKLHIFSQSVTFLLDDGKKKNPIAVLDGVRAIACLAVLTFHLNYAVRDAGIWRPIHDLGSLVGALALFGQSGVQLFFVLSGFLLFMPYAKSLLFHTPWPSLRRFYLRRIFRIVPAYYVALLLMILLFHQEFLDPDHRHALWLFLTFRMDFAETFQQISGPFWTLAVEFQFYIALPILAWVFSLIVRHGPLRWRLISLTICLLAMITWGMFTLYWGLKLSQTSALNFLISPGVATAIRPYIYGGTGKSFEVFAVGMLLSVIYVYSQNASPTSRLNTYLRRFSPILFIAGLALLFFMTLWHFYTWYYNYTLHFLDPYRNLLVPSWDQWQGLLYAMSFALCIAALLYGSPWLKRPFEWAPLRWIGLISFSLYMWHDPLLFFFNAHILGIVQLLLKRGSLQYGMFVLWIVVAIIPLSLCSYLLVEIPWIRVGEKLLRFIERPPDKQNTVMEHKPRVDTSLVDAPVASTPSQVS